MKYHKIFEGFRSITVAILMFLCSFSYVRGQEFQFTPEISHQIFYSSGMQAAGYNTNIATVQDDRWADMLAAQTSWPDLFKFKSVSNIIKIGVDHGNAAIVSNYKYRVSLLIHGYSSPTNPNSFDTKYAQVTVEYNKDSLKSYKDLSSFRISGAYHKLDVIITNIADISIDSTNTTQMPANLVAPNFFIEATISTQAFDLDTYPHSFFTTSVYDPNTEGLNVYFGYFSGYALSGIPACGSGYVPTFTSFNPAKYELEWTYVDDYKSNDFKNLPGSNGYQFNGSTWSISYNFKNNATRIQTYEHSFKIPIVYEHGAIVYRVRVIRPSNSNFSQLVYGDWDLPDAGTLTNTSFSSSNTQLPYICQEECLYFVNNTTAFNNDKFNWQYSINFAEEGKYKHVLNYFDGAGHNRQTQTKINSDDQYIVAADHIYDYEGRAGIQTLPTPVISQKLDYKPNLSYKAGTSTAYSAADFDKGCVSDSIYGFDTTNSMSGIYYSANNPDKTGMQAFVPDAKGYPFIETIYSPDNTNKVIWQGGAGYDFQHFKKHGTSNSYVRADQYELDKLFGTQSGHSEYYPKVITKDPNNQISYSIYNQSGKVVASALVGKNDTATPIVPIDNIADTTMVSVDLLANLTQIVADGSRSMNYSFYPDGAGNNSLFYHGKIPAYATGCGSWFVNVKGNYKINVFDECGISHYADSGIAGISNITGSNAAQTFSDAAVNPFDLTPDKFTIVKQLYFADTAISRLASQLVDSNSATLNQCYDYQDDFILRSVDSAIFPCVKPVDSDACDLLKKAMMAELYPGAKYGQYTQNADGTFAQGGYNSIFTQMTTTTSTSTIPSSVPGPLYGGFYGEDAFRPYGQWSGQSYYNTSPYSSWQYSSNGGSTWSSCSTVLIPWQYSYNGGTFMQFVGVAPNVSSLGNAYQFKTSIYVNDLGVNTNTRLNMYQGAPTNSGMLYYLNLTVNGVASGSMNFLGESTSIALTNLHIGWNDIVLSMGNLTGSHGDFQFGFTYQRDCSSCDNGSTTTTVTNNGLRYQSSCMHLPSISWPSNMTNLFNGQLVYIFGSASGAPPSALIGSFNDVMAAALLPLHPEYCKLLLCDDHIEDILNTITTYEQAQALGLDSLYKIMLADPICISTTNTNGQISQQDMSHFKIAAGNDYSNRLDSLSLEQAYCGCEGVETYLYCKNSEYSSQIKNFIKTDTSVQNSYIRRLIANYIANRESRIQVLMGSSTSCGPCQTQRMILTGTPIFPLAVDGSGSVSSNLGLPSDFQTVLNQASAGTTTTTPAYVSNAVTAALDSNILHQALNIMASLQNCTFPNLVPVTPTDSTLIVGDLTNTSNCGTDGKSLTPDIVKTILTNRNVPLNELCNPFLIDYSVYRPKASQVNTAFVDKGADFYTGLQTFINTVPFMKALTGASASGSAAQTLDFTPTNNRFITDLKTVLNYTTGTVSAVGYLKQITDGSSNQECIAVTISFGSNKDTLFFTQRLKNPPPSNCSLPLTASPIINQATTSLSFSGVHSVLDDSQILGLSDGLVADNLVFATLTSTVSGTRCGAYNIWGHTISMLKRKDPEATDGCINCVQMNTAAQAYFTNATAYSMPTFANDPTFAIDFTNYLNYNLGKSHSYDEYERLMKGCALSDKIAFKHSLGQYKVSFPTELAASVYMSTLNYNIGSTNIDYLSYKVAPSTVNLWFDLNSVPRDKYLKAKNVIAGASPVIEDMIPNALVSVLVAPGSCIPAWTTYAPAGTSVSTTPVYLKDDMGSYTLPYTLYSLINTGANSEKAIADLISSINSYFNTSNNPCASGIVLPSRQLMRSSDYNTPVKQSYLTYVYGLGSAGYSQSDISDKIAPNAVRTAIPALASDDLMSYKSPWCDNTKENLYYAVSPTTSNAGWNRLNSIVNAVTATSALNQKMFPSPTGVPTVTINGLGNSLKAILMSNGWVWYRYFDTQNKLYNVYLLPPVNMVDSSNAYKMVAGSLKAVVGADSIYRFQVNLQQTFTGLPTHTVTCYGYTDFSIGTGTALQNVVLFDNNNTPACLDTLPCERETLLTAIQQGKREYGAYSDSLKQYHYLAMRNYFPTSTVDTLDFKTVKQQYQYTLYYYDLAGNLNKTVPPAGVNPMGNISPVDIARNSTSAGTNLSLSTTYTPAHGKVSEYRYNSYNQLVSQTTPDAGTTNFFYDDARRIVFSQNAHQLPDKKYSYTLYDGQGRVYESGVIAFMASDYTGNDPNPTIVENSDEYSISDLAAIINQKAKEDVVATFYDSQLLTLASYPGLSAQENLRKRVSCILYKPQLAVGDTIQSYFAYATHFSYDALGNVKTLVQDNPYMDYMGQRFKRIDYDYDLLSGKVNMVSYNRGKADQFYHKYSYDADNRITTVQTSNDGMIWDRDAAYQYYRHGPLAKVSIGDQAVQTMQYAYTIQGWLKAINGDVLDTAVDMGKDGSGGGMFPADVIAHALDYYPGDYNAIGGVSPVTSDATSPLSKSLYNGNIARQATAINGLDNLQRTYHYDQLNRIKKADYTKIDNLSHAVVAMANASAYANSYSYDPDGNIKTLIRHNDVGAPMDSFTYTYQSAANNKLDNVADAVLGTSGNDLASGQTSGNYVYDEIGNLIHDSQGHIDSVFWNAYGKVEDMNLSGPNNFHIHYDYDGVGNRVRKDVFSTENGVDMRTSDVYVRDASGNIMAVYKGRSKLTDGYTIEWINDNIVSQHGGWVNPSNQGLSPFLVHAFGFNGQFINPLIHIGESINPSWSTNQSVSLSPTQFLTASDGIYLQATQTTFSDYFQPLVNSNASILTTAMQGGDGNSTPFIPLFNGLLSDTKLCTPTLIHMTTDAPVLTQAIMANLKLTYAGDVNRDANTLTAYVLKSGTNGVLSSYAHYVSLTPVDNFYKSLVTDKNILNGGWFANQPDISDQLSNAIYNFAPKTDAANFFGSYLPTIDAKWLENNSNIDDRLNIVYQNDQPTFMINYLNNVGISGVNSALHAIPQLTTASYVHAVWEAVLHGTLNPTYKPPDVNTPAPGSQLVADTLYLTEHHLYGGGRLGIKTYDTTAQLRSVYVGLNTTTNTPGYIADSTLNAPISWLDAGFVDWIQKGKTSTYTSGTFNLSTDSIWETRNLGAKQYELKDHLGNVLATVLDKKTGYGDSVYAAGGHFYKGLYANLSTVTDYYPFGMPMPGRSSAYGITPNNTIVTASTDFSDGTLQGWQQAGPNLPVNNSDRLQAVVTGPWCGALFIFNTHPGHVYRIRYNIDMANFTYINGSSIVTYPSWNILDQQVVAGSGVITHVFTAYSSQTAIDITSNGYTPNGINQNYYIDNFVVEEILPTPTAPPVAVTGKDYRMGFNGQEKTDEIYGKGNLNTAKFWEYDTRLGRRWNSDPVDQTNISNYATFVNNPLSNSDKMGNKPDVVIYGENNSSLTLITPAVTAKISLRGYGMGIDLQGNNVIDITSFKPDAIGIDLSIAGQSPIIGLMGGVNFLWHTRGEKEKDENYPEIHTYGGGQFGLTSGLSVNGSIGFFFGYAKNDDGSPASDQYVANGFNWTGTFWGKSIAIGEGVYSGGAGIFTARNPSQPAQGPAWSGFGISWTPGLYSKGGKGTGSISSLLRSAQKMTMSGTLNQSYYFMNYGNGSDFLPSSKKDVSGWHLWNPIDPKDDKK